MYDIETFIWRLNDLFIGTAHNSIRYQETDIACLLNMLGHSFYHRYQIRLATPSDISIIKFIFEILFLYSRTLLFTIKIAFDLWRKSQEG